MRNLQQDLNDLVQDLMDLSESAPKLENSSELSGIVDLLATARNELEDLVTGRPSWVMDDDDEYDPYEG